MPKLAIQVRVSAEQRDEIRARAERAGLSLSDYIRRRALGEVEIEAGVEPPGHKVPPPASTATPEPGAKSEAQFMERRTRELYGRGQTSRAARAAAAAELELDAKRYLGEALARGGKHSGRLKRGPVVTPRNHGEPPTLADLGLTKRQSADAQKLAEIPDEDYERFKVGARSWLPSCRRRRTSSPSPASRP